VEHQQQYFGIDLHRRRSTDRGDLAIGGRERTEDQLAFTSVTWETLPPDRRAADTSLNFSPLA